MKRVAFLIFVALIVYCAVSLGQEIYQWVDEKGTVHFTDDPSLIPEKYQDQVQKREPPAEPPSSITAPKGKGTLEPDAADIEKKDLLGRGEEWWRNKAMEWRKRLTKAQKDYNAALAALKAKEEELQQSIYKPESLKRRLRAEIKALQEKVNERKSQVDEAKNMLERTLPKQAEEYHADPSWLRID